MLSPAIKSSAHHMLACFASPLLHPTDSLLKPGLSAGKQPSADAPAAWLTTMKDDSSLQALGMRASSRPPAAPAAATSRITVHSSDSGGPFFILRVQIGGGKGREQGQGRCSQRWGSDWVAKCLLWPWAGLWAMCACAVPNELAC